MEESVNGKRRPCSLETNRICCTDAHEGLKKLPDKSVDCVVTSPPYWATRDYGVGRTKWPDGSDCALGLEPSVDLYIVHLCSIFDEVKRVLKSTGTLWVNLGDTYHNATKWTKSDQVSQTICHGNSRNFKTGRRENQGLPEKCLTLIPFRFALEMINRGWILRNDIVWHKPNHMPSSVKDRFAGSWEHMLLFVKSPRYFFDLDAVRVPHVTAGAMLARSRGPSPARSSPHVQGTRLCPNPGEPQSAHPLGKNPGDFWAIAAETRTLGAIIGKTGVVKVPGGAGWVGHVPGGMARIVRESDSRWLPPNGKNPGDVWQVHTRPSFLGHFAMFPEKLVERPILAGCPQRVCKRCGTPRLTRAVSATETRSESKRPTSQHSRNKLTNKIVLGCHCKRGFEPGMVLDPFIGTGTTAVVAKRFGRRFIGFELNPEYAKVARLRIAKAAAEASRLPSGKTGLAT